MRVAILALLTLCVPSPATVPQQDILEEYEIQIKADLWKGWKEGSWVERKITNKDGSGKRVGEYRITLDRIAENGYCFKVDTLDDGKVESSRLLVKLNYGVYVGESKQTDNVKIGDKTFTCFVQEYKTDTSLQRTLECKEAPGIVVRVENESTYDGKKSTMKQEITALGVEHSIGDKKVSCWKVEKNSDSQSGPTKTIITSLFSNDVPGGHVRREQLNDWAGNKSSVVDEVTKFEGKK